MKKPTLTCTTPYRTFHRGTFRSYTHVVVLVHPDNTATDISWHASEALARQARTSARLELARSYGGERRIEIFPVDVDGRSA
jgi:allantoicase